MSDDESTTTEQLHADDAFDVDTAPDLGELEERGTVVHIQNARGEPMYANGQPVTMTVLGTYSKTYRRLQTAQRDQLIRARRSSVSATQLEQRDMQLVAACVTAWHGFTASGTPIPLTKENVLKVFTKFPYVLEQVKEEMSARENFSESSASSSGTR